MADTVIVALPPVDDRVMKVSSEEVAHLTLLYLGSVELSAEAVLYIQHACSELSPFGATVDYRGILGEDNADVLFFEDNAYDLKRVREFRHYLLLNDEIKRAYDSAVQFPEWTPHLTLGYPETPANEDDEDYKLSYVHFDRIAVWNDDFSGPEFRLKYEDYAMEVAMSDISTVDRGETAVDEIFHFGVKGMKWGVRNNDSGGGRGKFKRGLTKANAALEAGGKVIREGEKKLIFLPQENRNKAASATQTQVLAAARTINKSPQFKGKDLKGNTRLRNAYMKKVEAAAKDIYADELGIARTEAWADFLGTKVDTTSMRITAISNRVQHAEEDDGLETLMEMNFDFDELGHIIKVNVPDKYLSHTGPDIELFHYGVKGMKWGVTRKSDGTVEVNQTKVKKSLRKTDQPVTVTQRKAGTYVKTKGGKRQTASNDAVKAQAGRQVAKKSTTDALSNKQLKDTIERMRLEQEFKKLDSKVSRRGRGFVGSFLQSPAAKQAAEDLLKKAQANAA